MRILYNSEFSFSERLYGPLDVDVCRIKLHEPLSVICKQPLLYIRDMVPKPCFQSLVKLEEVRVQWFMVHWFSITDHAFYIRWFTMPDLTIFRMCHHVDCWQWGYALTCSQMIELEQLLLNTWFCNTPDFESFQLKYTGFVKMVLVQHKQTNISCLWYHVYIMNTLCVVVVV